MNHEWIANFNLDDWPQFEGLLPVGVIQDIQKRGYERVAQDEFVIPVENVEVALGLLPGELTAYQEYYLALIRHIRAGGVVHGQLSTDAPWPSIIVKSPLWTDATTGGM